MRLVALCGGLGAVGLTLYVGYAGPNHPPVFLMALMAIWVAFPFVVFGWAAARAPTWPPPVPAAFRGALLIATLGTLLLYAHDVVVPPATTRAFLFVAVPPASLAFCGVVVALAALLSRPR